MRGADLNPLRTRLILTPDTVTELRVYYVSCVMPENPGAEFKVDKLPKLPKQNHSPRVLVIAGNLSKLIGDIPECLINEFFADPNKSHWDWAIWVAGPRDYWGTDIGGGDTLFDGHGQLCPGHVICLQADKTTCVEFVNPGVKIFGAPLWPKEERLYQGDNFHHTVIYDQLKDQTSNQSRVQTVIDRKYISSATLRKRFNKDVAELLMIARKDRTRENNDERVVVTFGCPYDHLALNGVAGRTADYATVNLGNEGIYEAFQNGVDHWIVGGYMDRRGEYQDASECHGNVAKVGRVFFRNNRYDALHQRFPVQASDPDGILILKGRHRAHDVET